MPNPSAYKLIDSVHAECMHSDTMSSMKNVQVRNVPERVHRVLRRRAAAAGQSLQEYLLNLLEESTGRLTVEEWVQRVRKHASDRLEPGEAARIIREGREERDEELFGRFDE